MYDRLKGEIARLKQLKRFTYSDLAKMTGYSTNTIAAFMCGVRDSEQVASAIKEALNINVKEE